MTRYWCAHAWLPGGLTAGVLVDAGATITAVSHVDVPPPDAVRFDGVVFPGFANVHSHAFHRALRGRTHSGGGTFWTWREAMYSLAQRLQPDAVHALARAVYAEMAASGITCVGEFHYLHHDTGGRRYTDPNVMAEALRSAAAEAGIRLTLLDTCYLSGGIGVPLDGVQRRFGDADVDAWAQRVSVLRPDAGTRIGAAVHSVRAVPASALPVAATVLPDAPLHVHLSEQPAENTDCLAAYGCTPAALLASSGLLGPRTTAVHATHLSAGDFALLGGSGTTACLCPATEADLADGIGPAGELAAAGTPLALGTDQHVAIDLLAEARALEQHQRLRTGRRGHFSPAALTAALTAHHALGWSAGRIAVGAPCDLVHVRTDTARTAGALPEQLVHAASASDVDTVVVGGKVVAERGWHTALGDVGALAATAVAAAWA